MPKEKDEPIEEIIPMGDKGETYALSIAFTKALVQRIDRLAKETRNNRSDTIRHMVRFALESYERKRVRPGLEGESQSAN